MKNKIIAFLILMTVLMLTLPACRLPSDDDGMETNAEHNEMLSSIGVDTNLGARKDPNEEDLVDDYNPIGPKVGVLFKQCEIYAAGVEIDGKSNGLFEDRKDGNASFPVIFGESDDSWASGYAKSAIAADVDGDGIDEIVVSIFYDTTDEIVLHLVDINDGESVTDEARRFSAHGDLSAELDGTAGGDKSWEDAFLRQDLAAGDIDGDGKQEIILVEAGYIFILDDADAGFSTINGFEVYNLNDEKDTYVRVAVADFDADGLDEIIVANGEDDQNIQAEYSLYDDIIADPEFNDPLIERRGIYKTGDNVTVKLSAAGVVAGDFDGDGLIEAAFAGQRMESSGIATLILDTRMDEDSEPVFEFLADSGGDNNEADYIIPAMASGDIDGDGDDEIVVWEDIYHLSGPGGSLDQDELWGNEALTNNLPGEMSRDNPPEIDLISIGDVTGDMKEDVVFITDDIIRVVYVEGDGTLGYYDISVGSTPSRPTLCLPNVDDDSAVVEYLGNELLFTDPIIVAVLASPPYWAGINGSSEGYVGHTGFGYIQGSSNESSESHGFSVGFSVGAGFSAPFGLGKVEMKTSVENSFTWGVATTSEITETWGYTTTLGEDKVIFTSVPFDVYYYKILSSPDETQIGETVTINVPRNPGQYHQELSYYNSHNGDGYDLEDSELKHSIGVPFSYHNEDDKDEFIENQKGIFSGNYLEVGTGSSTTVITLTETEGEKDSFEYELGVTVEAEIGAGGVTAGVSAGYNYGYSYSTTTTAGTYFEGEVPDIPQEGYSSDTHFKWGLMAYPVEDEGQKFTMVTYWTDGM
ncbi:MAG: hypothetical protein JEY99_11775 [Spirochaetales bacterium]|nr:hypothetical protein [Spirochaetales bacterium]